MEKAISIQQQISHVKKTMKRSKTKSAILRTLRIVLDSKTKSNSELYVLATNDVEKVKYFFNYKSQPTRKPSESEMEQK
jgi:hypothetical protein